MKDLPESADVTVYVNNVFTMYTKGGEDLPDGNGGNSSTSYSYYVIYTRLMEIYEWKGYFQYTYIFEQDQCKQIQYNNPDKQNKTCILVCIFW